MLNMLSTTVMLRACCQSFAWRQAHDNDHNAAQHHVSVRAADCAQISSTIKAFIKSCQDFASLHLY